MAKLSQLNLPVKDESTGQITSQTFDIGGADYTAGYGIDITNGAIATRTFVGTTAEWEALTPTQQAAYTFLNFTDDSSEVIPLSGLSDVVITNPTDRQSLVYDETNEKWINETVKGGDGTIASYDEANENLFFMYQASAATYNNENINFSTT